MKKRILFFISLIIALSIFLTFAACDSADDTSQNETASVAGKYAVNSGYWLDSDIYVIEQTIEFFADGSAKMATTLLSVSTGETISPKLDGFYVWEKGDYIDCIWEGSSNAVSYLYTGITIDTGYATLYCIGENSLGEFEGMYNRVSYGINGPGNIEGDAIQYVLDGGNTTSVTAVPSLGAEFVRWSDGVLTPTRTDDSVSDNISVFAEFRRVTDVFSLYYSAGTGGTIQGERTQEVLVNGSGTEVTAVPDEGYGFIKWSDGVTTATRTDTNITQHLSVTAEFGRKITLSYSAGEGGTVQGESTQELIEGTAGTSVTAVPNEGWYFVSWTDGVDTPTRTDTPSYHGNSTVNFSATFAPYHTVKYIVYGEGGTIQGDTTQLVKPEETPTAVTAVPDEGYKLKGWYEDSVSDGNLLIAAGETFSGGPIWYYGDGTTTYYVAFEPIGYICKYYADTGGTIEGATVQSVPVGGNGTAVTAVPDEGYAFVRWSDGLTAATRTDTDVNGNISVTAEFEIDPDYTPFAGGDGSVENPYMIDGLSRLRAMSLYPSAHFVLTADLVLPEGSADKNNFVPLFSDEKPFMGTLDGAGYKITNLTISNTETFYSGLFSVIGSTGSVKNLTFENASVSGTNYIGIIAGWSLGSITDCTVSGAVTHIAANSFKVFVGGIAGLAEGNVDGCSADVDLTVTEAQSEVYSGGIVGYLSFESSSSSPLTLSASGTTSVSSDADVYVGGLVGHASTSLYLNKCRTEMQITASSGTTYFYAGGLIGYSFDYTITDSYATGNVTAVGSSYYSYAGGLTGDGNGTIIDSYATGNVTASGSQVSYVGGLAGHGSVYITDSYATGDVSAASDDNSYVGGLAGYGYGAVRITDSYATGNVSASGSYSYAGGLAGYGAESITDSYATGNVAASGSQVSYVGGLAGYALFATVTVRNAYSSSAVYAEGSRTVYAGGLMGYAGDNVSLENAHWLKSADTDVIYAVGYSNSLGVPTSIGSTSHTVLDEFYTLADTLNAGREAPVWEHTGENTLPSLINGDDESAE